jgi:hypothetical protein
MNPAPPVTRIDDGELLAGGGLENGMGIESGVCFSPYNVEAL